MPSPCLGKPRLGLCGGETGSSLHSALALTNTESGPGCAGFGSALWLCQRALPLPGSNCTLKVTNGSRLPCASFSVAQVRR